VGAHDVLGARAAPQSKHERADMMNATQRVIVKGLCFQNGRASCQRAGHLLVRPCNVEALRRLANALMHGASGYE
jgi:hypothetical protein